MNTAAKLIELRQHYRERISRSYYVMAATVTLLELICLAVFQYFKSDIMTVTVAGYALRYVLLPSVLNFTIVFIVNYIVRGKYKDQVKDIAILAGILAMCLVVCAIHNYFPATQVTFCLPLMLTLFVGKARVSWKGCLVSVWLLIVAILLAPYFDAAWSYSFLFLNTACTIAILFAMFLLSRMFAEYTIRKRELVEEDIAKQSEESDQLRKDPLTGLYNFADFYATLDEYLEGDECVTVALLDIDLFRNINETFGYDKGDEVIIRLAEILTNVCAKNGKAFRYGGEEFAVVFKGASESRVFEWMESVRRHFRDAYFPFMPERHLGVSCGIYESDGLDNAQNAFDYADQALYYAKTHGRNRIVCYSVVAEETSSDFAAVPDEYTGIDTTGLTSRIFTGFAETAERRYCYLCNMKTMVCRWSRNAVEQFNLPGEYILNSGPIWGERIHPEDRAAYEEDIRAVIAGKKSRHDMDYRVLNRDGQYDRCSCRGLVLKGKDGADDIFIGTIINHSQRDKVDAVTNLFNDYEYTRMIRQAQNDGKTMLLMALGLNHFSEINSVYGYDIGNQVLAKFSEKFLSVVKGQGKIYKMNGIRFIYALENGTQEDAADIYYEIRNIVRRGLHIGDSHIMVDTSCAATIYDGQYDSKMIRPNLRQALTVSRYENAGELVFVGPEQLEESRKKLRMLGYLQESIQNNFEGFHLVYQPVVNSKTEKMTGMEALLRWRHEELGEVSPGIFIPMLENEPSFFDLGNWILETAMRETKPMLEKQPALYLNVNIAYPQLKRREFKTCLQQAIERVGFPPGNLCLELTERCRQMERDDLIREIGALHEMGCLIALDDFGTGYSSLNLLSEIPVDLMKIDRSFILDVATNAKNRSIIKAVTGCASDMNIRVCVEGVEDWKTIELLNRYPVNTFQGFYYSRPVPIEQVMNLQGVTLGN